MDQVYGSNEKYLNAVIILLKIGSLQMLYCFIHLVCKLTKPKVTPNFTILNGKRCKIFESMYNVAGKLIQMLPIVFCYPCVGYVF